MEFIEKGELYKIVEEKGKLREKEAKQYIYEATLAIKYLHDNHIIHRDLKAENLLLTDDNSIKIADFGWSNFLGNNNPTRKTFCGTVEYLAPEMLVPESKR